MTAADGRIEGCAIILVAAADGGGVAIGIDGVVIAAADSGGHAVASDEVLIAAAHTGPHRQISVIEAASDHCPICAAHIGGTATYSCETARASVALASAHRGRNGRRSPTRIVRATAHSTIHAKSGIVFTARDRPANTGTWNMIEPPAAHGSRFSQAPVGNPAGHGRVWTVALVGKATADGCRLPEGGVTKAATNGRREAAAVVVQTAANRAKITLNDVGAAVALVHFRATAGNRGAADAADRVCERAAHDIDDVRIGRVIGRWLQP